MQRTVEKSVEGKGIFRSIDYGSKNVQILLEENSNTVLTKITKVEGRKSRKGETTKIYVMVADLLQDLANQRQEVLEERFSTSHEKLTEWIKIKGVLIGYKITGEAEGVVVARRYFYPKEKRRKVFGIF